jgi:hypothetical protein
MDLPLAMSATGKGAMVLLVTGVMAPLIGLLLRRVAGGWDEIGQGPLSMQHEPESSRRPAAGAPGLIGFAADEPVDREAQEAEVRQMLLAKAERQRRQGERPIDVEAEVRRLLRPGLTIS